MQAGTLDQRVDIQSRTDTRDAVYGQPQASWSNFATDIPANVMQREVGTPEPVVTAQQQTVLRIFLRMRYVPGVLSTMRVKHGTRYYQIQSVITVGRNEETRLTCTEYNEGRR